MVGVDGVDGRCCVARRVLDAKKKEVRLYLDAVAATNDNFYIKELPEMQEAGIVIVSD